MALLSIMRVSTTRIPRVFTKNQFACRHCCNYVRRSRFFPELSAAVSGFREKEVTDFRAYDKMQKYKLINQYASGLFALSPLMTRSLEKLHRIIDNEMQQIGALKLNLPTLGLKSDWMTAGRWELMGGELMKFTDRVGKPFCLSPTHEEAVTRFVRYNQIGENQMPIMLYQIGKKYRDELRPKHGLLRAREFEMKDLYSFDPDEKAAFETYERVTGAYEAIFKRLGLDYIRVAAGSGTMGGSTSHEFHLPLDLGEDILFQCEQCNKCFNSEVVFDRNNKILPGCTQKKQDCKFKRQRGIEVAHTFVLGTKYTEAQNMRYMSREGNHVLAYMGCYGIGVTRLLAAALETLSSPNSKNLVWPRVLAPFQIAVTGDHFKNPTYLEVGERLCSELSRFAHLRRDVLLFDGRKPRVLCTTDISQTYGIPHIVQVKPHLFEQNPPRFHYEDTYTGTSMTLTEQEIMGIASGLDSVPV